MSIKKRVFVVFREDDDMLFKEVVHVYGSYKDAYDYVKDMDERDKRYHYKIRSCDYTPHDIS